MEQHPKFVASNGLDDEAIRRQFTYSAPGFKSLTYAETSALFDTWLKEHDKNVLSTAVSPIREWHDTPHLAVDSIIAVCFNKGSEYTFDEIVERLNGWADALMPGGENVAV